MRSCAVGRIIHIDAHIGAGADIACGVIGFGSKGVGMSSGAGMSAAVGRIPAESIGTGGVRRLKRAVNKELNP